MEMMKMKNMARRRVGVESQERIRVDGGHDNVEAISTEQRKDNLIVRALRKMRLVGLRQALKPGTSWMESAFWIGVFVLCVVYTVYLTWLSVEEYSKNPTTNTLHDDANINSVNFPAISVTGTMAFTKTGMEEAFDIHEERYFDAGDQNNHSWTHDGVTKLLFAVDHFCEMVSSFASELSILKLAHKLNLKSFGDWVSDQNVTIRDDPSDSTLRDQVMPFIRKNTLDCQSILVACMWERNKENCSELFVPVQTDVGVGCTFNRIPEELLKTSQGVMSLLYNRTTSEDELAAWRSWDIDTELRNSIDRLKHSRLFPRSQNAAGNMKGLSFLLLHKNEDDFSCPVMNSKGFLVGVHHPFEEPQMMTSGVAVPPGHEVLVKVRGEVTLADPELRSLAIEKRNCYFQDECFLKMYKKYTLGNCRRECLANKIAAECKCHQLSMSSGKNETICGPLAVECVRNVTRDLDRDGYDKLCEGQKCLAPCTDIKYETNVSYLPYHSNNVFDFSDTHESKLKLLSSNASTSIVHVTYESDRVTTRERKLVLPFAFLVGVIGGIWGMTLEFSVASFFNILAGFGVLLAPICAMRCIRRSSKTPKREKPNSFAMNDSIPTTSEDIDELGAKERTDEESSSSSWSSPSATITNDGVEGHPQHETSTEIQETPEESGESMEEFYDSSEAEHPHQDTSNLEGEPDEVESPTCVSRANVSSARIAKPFSDYDDELYDQLNTMGQSNCEESNQNDNDYNSAEPSEPRQEEPFCPANSKSPPMTSEDIKEQEKDERSNKESQCSSGTIVNDCSEEEAHHEDSTETEETSEESHVSSKDEFENSNEPAFQSECTNFAPGANVSLARIANLHDDSDGELNDLMSISREDCEASIPANYESILEETTDLTNELAPTDARTDLDKEIDELMEVIIL